MASAMPNDAAQPDLKRHAHNAVEFAVFPEHFSSDVPETFVSEQIAFINKNTKTRAAFCSAFYGGAYMGNNGRTDSGSPRASSY